MLQPLDPIHLAIHCPIFFRNMLEVAPQSLTPRTGKSTLSKSMGLPVYHWSSSAGFYHPILNPGLNRKVETIQTTGHPGLSGVSSRVSVYAFWRRNPTRLLAEVGSISPRHLQWRCAKNMQSWDFNCLFRRLKSSSSRQLPKGFRFLCSQRGRESCSSFSNEVQSCCIMFLSNLMIFRSILVLFSVGSRAETCFSSDWCQAGASRECKDGRVWKGCACVHGREQILKESPGCSHTKSSIDWRCISVFLAGWFLQSFRGMSTAERSSNQSRCSAVSTGKQQLHLAWGHKLPP